MIAEPDLVEADKNRELEQFLDKLNEKLRSAGSESSEQAFGMGCGLGLAPVVVILLLLLVFRVINIILAFTLAVMAVLAMVGVGMLLASFSRTNTIRRTYWESIDPEINAYIARTGLERSQFELLACTLLPDGAPLKAFIKSSTPLQGDNPGRSPANQE